jgi:hypothetical protein
MSSAMEKTGGFALGVRVVFGSSTNVWTAFLFLLLFNSFAYSYVHYVSWTTKVPFTWGGCHMYDRDYTSFTCNSSGRVPVGKVLVSVSISGFLYGDNHGCSGSPFACGCSATTTTSSSVSCTNHCEGELNQSGGGSDGYTSTTCYVAYEDDVLHPCPNFAATEPAAQALLAYKQEQCEAGGGSYSGTIVPQGDGSYCVEDGCEPDSCPEGMSGSSFLPKRSISERSSEKFLSDENAADYSGKTSWPSLYYDALGRRTEPRPEARRQLFEVKKDKTTVYLDSWNENNNFKLKKSSAMQCYKNFNKEWVCTDISQSLILKKGNDGCGIIGVHYGIIEEDGTRTGGITCPFVTAMPEYPLEGHELCSNGSKLQVDFDLTITPELTRNEIFYIKKGYVFSDNSIATEEDEIAMYYHELGHKKYNECLEFPVITKRISGCYCKTEIYDKVELEKDKAGQIYKEMLDNADSSFHKKYGKDGYATTYECPN